MARTPPAVHLQLALGRRSRGEGPLEGPLTSSIAPRLFALNFDHYRLPVPAAICFSTQEQGSNDLRD